MTDKPILPDEELDKLLKSVRALLGELVLAESVTGRRSIAAAYVERALEAFGGNE